MNASFGRHTTTLTNCLVIVLATGCSTRWVPASDPLGEPVEERGPAGPTYADCTVETVVDVPRGIEVTVSWAQESPFLVVQNLSVYEQRRWDTEGGMTALGVTGGTGLLVGGSLWLASVIAETEDDDIPPFAPAAREQAEDAETYASMKNAGKYTSLASLGLIGGVFVLQPFDGRGESKSRNQTERRDILERHMRLEPNAGVSTWIDPSEATAARSSSDEQGRTTLLVTALNDDLPRQLTVTGAVAPGIQKSCSVDIQNSAIRVRRATTEVESMLRTGNYEEARSLAQGFGIQGEAYEELEGLHCQLAQGSAVAAIQRGDMYSLDGLVLPGFGAPTCDAMWEALYAPMMLQAESALNQLDLDGAWEWLDWASDFSDRAYWASVEERIYAAQPRSWDVRATRALARCDAYANEVRARRNQLYAIQASGNVAAFETAMASFENWLYDQEDDPDGVFGALEELEEILYEMEDWEYETDISTESDRMELMYRTQAHCDP